MPEMLGLLLLAMIFAAGVDIIVRAC